MSFFKQHWRTLLSAATLAVLAIHLSGCGGSEKPGTLIDKRDKQSYRTVKIGGLVWMAENLNYKTDGSYCYEDKDDNCNKYGRLYDMGYENCPKGWHVPSSEEWDDLFRIIGNRDVSLKWDDENLSSISGDSSVIGKKLKSKSGWDDDANGTDDYGFSALPGGSRSTFGTYSGIGTNSAWWTSSQTETEWSIYNGLPLARFLSANNSVSEGYSRKMGGDENEGESDGYSVRCVMDGGTLGAAGGGGTGTGDNTANAADNKCGSEKFDPEGQFCHQYLERETDDPLSDEVISANDFSGITFSYKVLGKCGGKEYIPVSQECVNGEVKELANNDFVEKCGGTYYDYGYYTNGKLSILKGGKKGGKFYDSKTDFCVETCAGCCDYGADSRTVEKKCGGKEYDPLKEFCHNNRVIKICNAAAARIGDYCGYDDTPPPNVGKFDPTTDFCHNDTAILKKCGDKTYDPDAQQCQDGQVVDK